MSVKRFPADLSAAICFLLRKPLTPVISLNELGLEIKAEHKLAAVESTMCVRLMQSRG